MAAAHNARDPSAGSSDEQLPEDLSLLEKLAWDHHQAGRFLPALRIYDRIIDLGGATAETWCATGNALTTLGEYAQAIGAYENSLKIDAQNPEAHHNLARALYRLGEVDRAACCLRIAGTLCDAIDPWLGLATIIPGCLQADLEAILDVRKTYARRLADLNGLGAAGRGACKQGSTEGGPRRNPTRGNDPLRVGYLSAHFHRPNYMKPVWALINEHDRAAFEIHLFSDDAAGGDMPGYLAHPRDRLHEVGRLNNGELADLMQSCGIDILVDLSGYSQPARLPLFLRHAAPVTVAWFNTYATSGLSGLDYVIGDDEVVRHGEERFFTEEVLRLPISYLTFQVSHPAPPIVAPPCVTRGHLTFGSLVSQYKIAPPVLDAWAEILKRADQARLLLANAALKSIWNRQYLADQFARRGVDRDRLTLEGPADHFAFLQHYDRIDVALDAFPYNGGTTTMEAIWQGVPVLTFEGDRWASRTSQSLLRRTHLGEFVAKDATAMIDFAIELARDRSAPARLSELRRQMRQRLRESSACQARALAQNMERLYHLAWAR
jgi:protein O-GlcNAc transferase